MGRWKRWRDGKEGCRGRERMEIRGEREEMRLGVKLTRKIRTGIGGRRDRGKWREVRVSL
jgi:hypothetical protein